MAITTIDEERRPLPVSEVIAGTTIRVSWVNSGTQPSEVISTLWDRSETLVASVAAVESAGRYYAHHVMPSSPGLWYMNRWYAVIDSRTYITPRLIRATWPKVD